MRLMLAFLCIISLFSMVGCSDEEQPLEPESQLSFESENLAPLLNTEGGQLFVKAPWDVNGDGNVDLFDLVLADVADEHPAVRIPRKVLEMAEAVGPNLWCDPGAPDERIVRRYPVAFAAVSAERVDADDRGLGDGE